MERSRRIAAALAPLCMAAAVWVCAGNASPAETAGESGYVMPELAGTPTNYADEANWLHIPEIKYAVDTVYIYPTVYVNAEKDAPAIAPVEDETMRMGAQSNFALNEGAYSESTNVFAPYYRQTNLMKVLDYTAEEFEKFQYNEQRTDVYAALDYYFEKYNDGRPYILAGHSQGSAMLRIALKDYMQAHPAYYARMVAAYVLGYSVTKEDLEKYPHLKFAEGADDTGVIVSWNIEGPGNRGQHNAVVLDGAVSINPINWKRDETYAPAEDNLGTYVNDQTAGGYVKAPVKADAQVDLERGVVICTSEGLPFISEKSPMTASFFGPESYHNGDYPFYFDNLKENVRVRCEAYLAAH